MTLQCSMTMYSRKLALADKHPVEGSQSNGMLTSHVLQYICNMLASSFEFSRTFSAAFDEESICHLHDVSLVNCCDFVSAIVASIFERILSYSSTGDSCDDLWNHEVSESYAVLCKDSTFHSSV